MDFVLASRNQKKIREMEAILSAVIPEIRILSLDDIHFKEEIEENGKTFEQNALIKASTVVEATNYELAAIADDSGLEVKALDYAPGIYSARYAGGHGDDAANNELLLKNLENVPDEERKACFVSAIACVFPNGDRLVVRGEARGQILRDYRGEGGFGYDPLFLYLPENDHEPHNKTFSEMSAEEKNVVSHRGKAIKKLADALVNYLNS